MVYEGLSPFVERYKSWGLNIFPLIHHTKHPALQWEPYQDRRATEAEYIKWFSTNNVGIGIICGRISGNFAAIDCDSEDLFLAIAAYWKEAFGDSIADMTPIVRSREGHYQIYLRFREMPRLYHPKGEARKSVPDIQGEGGFVVAPPSIHPETGKPYEFLNPDTSTVFELDSVADLEIEVPEGARKLIIPAKSEKIAEGSRNSVLTSMAGSMRRRGMTEAAIFAALVAENKERCEPSLSEREVLNIAHSVAKYEPASLSRYSEDSKVGIGHHHTDMGNAQRFAADHHDNVRFCNSSGAWFIWNGQRWARDVDGGIVRKAKQTVTNLYMTGAAITDEKDREKAIRWALQSEAEPRIKAMLSLAESEPNMPVALSELDTDPWLLNVRNGTLDLRTGELRSHEPKNLLSKLAPVKYDPNAQCPLWLSFLDLIFDRRKKLISFLQRAIGYSLSGDISEQVLFLLYGLGSNGKSTLLEIIRLILGDYALNTPFSTFVLHDNEAVRNDLARMVGARFVSSIEVKDAQRLDEVVVKQLTGGDTITARFLYREFFEFVPTFKLWLAVNHKPVIRGTEEAIWRRIRLIPFDVTIPENIRDKKFPLKLVSELSGILNWSLQGCLDWQKQGLNAADEVLQATASYRSEMDILGNFLTEYVVHRPGAKLDAKALYDQYCSWCEREGEKAISSVWFSRNLHDRGFKVQRTTGGKRQWLEVAFSDGILP